MNIKSTSFFRHYLLFILSFFLFVSCQEQEIVPISKGDDGQIFAVDTEQSELPYLVINTQGKEVLYEPAVPATLKLYKQKKLVQTQGITLEYRGKTSFRLSDKKGYNVETVDASGAGVDVSFLGMPLEEDWRLIGHVVNLKDKYLMDQSLIYNYLGYELSAALESTPVGDSLWRLK